MSPLRQDILKLQEEIKCLTLLVLKDKVDKTWMTEKEAALSLGYNNPRSLRRKVVLTDDRISKGEKVQYPYNLITYRCTNGRNYQYSRRSIMKFKEQTSTELF